MYAQLRTLLMSADLGSVSIAARRLYLTQPALTQHIRSLEEQFGVKLLRRVGNAMELTPEGKRLYDASKSLIASFEGLKEIFAPDEASKETLQFSTIDSITLSILPTTIKRVRKACPQARLVPHVEASGLAIQHLLAGELDLALCTLDHLPRSLGKESLFEERLIFIGAPEHRAIRNARKLYDLPMILLPRSSMTRSLIDKALSDLKIAPQISLETIKVSTIIAFVEAGMGVSLVPNYSVQKELKSGRIVEIPIKVKARRTVGVAYSRERPLSPLALTFIRELRKQGAKLR